MQFLLLALIFPCLSWQLPHNAPGPKSVQRRTGPESFDLTRVRVNAPSLKSRGVSPIQDVDQRQKYLVPVTVEEQTFLVELDTGSSDLWLIQTGFTCYNSHKIETFTFSSPTTQAVCNFGPTYSPGQGFVPKPDVELLVEYGDQTRAVAGEMGYADVTIGSITVNQLIGAPINSSFPGYGDHVMTGIMGVGFSRLTHSFSVVDDSYEEYDSLMLTIFGSGRYAAQFSLALSRDDSMNGVGGIFTIGGLPENTTAVNVSTSEPTTAKFQIFPSADPTEQTYYAIDVDSVVLGTQTLNPNLRFIIDSGNPRLDVPSSTANAINALWSPPLESDGRTLPCNATLTVPVGIAVGGRTYYMESRDLLGIDENGVCFSLVFASSQGGVFNVLGDPFLKNVLAVFDWTQNGMEFYPRQYYES